MIPLLNDKEASLFPVPLIVADRVKEARTRPREGAGPVLMGSNGLMMMMSISVEHILIDLNLQCAEIG